MCKFLKQITILLLIFLCSIEAAFLKSGCKELYYGRLNGKNVGYLEVVLLHYSFFEALKLEMDFYVPDNANYSSLGVRVKRPLTAMRDMCDGKPITFIIEFPYEALEVATVRHPPNACSSTNRNFNRPIVTATFNEKFNEMEVIRTCNEVLNTAGVNKDYCGQVNDQEIFEGLSSWPWMAKVLVNGKPVGQVVLVTKTRAFTGQWLTSLTKKNMDEVQLVLSNNKTLSVWKYEALLFNMVLFLWPDLNAETIVPACIHTFYQSMENQVKHPELDRDLQFILPDICEEMCGNQSILAVTDTKEICTPCWNYDENLKGTSLAIPKSDEGGALMIKNRNKWNLRGLLNAEYNRFHNINIYLIYIVSLHGQGSEELESPCKEILYYWEENGVEVALFEVAVQENKVLEFNVTAEFYVPEEVFVSKKNLEVTVQHEGRDNEKHTRKLIYTVHFPGVALPLKRIVAGNEIICENRSEKYKHNPVIQGFHALISDPLIQAEQDDYENKRNIDERNCGTFKNESYPWVAEVFTGDASSGTCLGTIIGRSLAVSAVNQLCWYPNLAESMFVKVLLSNETIKVVNFIQHPLYKYEGLESNVALLLLEKEITTPGFVPICLWKNQNTDVPSVGLKGIVIGHEREMVNVQVVDAKECDSSKHNFNENSFCGKFDSPHNACYLSGSSFMIEQNGRWYLRGVYSIFVQTPATGPRSTCVAEHAIFTDSLEYFDWFRNIKRPLRSPCPAEFQYGEEDGKNVAFLEVPVLRSQVYGFNVSLEFFVPKGESVPNEPLNVTLRNDEQTVVQKVLTRGRILYVVTFPGRPMNLIRIFFSGKLICENQEVIENLGRNPVILLATDKFKPSINVIAEYDRFIGAGINEEGCGDLKRNFSVLNVGGEKTDKKNWPWVASLYVKDEHKCSSSLITRSVAVTAAHCLNMDSKKILAADITLKLFNDQDATIWDYITHTGFNGPALNDIALLLLNEDISNPDFVPICVWSYFEDIENVKGTLVSYGATELVPSGKINFLDMKAVSSVTCGESDKRLKRLVNENTFCATGPKGTGPCHGDSGGGFVFQENSVWYLRGVVSTSLIDEYGECDTDHYTVFMDIEKYFDWIKSSNKTLAENKVDKETMEHKNESKPQSYFIGDMWVWV